MRAIFSISISLAVSLLTVLPVFCQTDAPANDRYSLLTKPYNKRPLNVYKGQLQTNVGYQFAIKSGTFDAEGKKKGLKDIGTASVYHYYFLEVKYGITSFLEISAATNYMKSAVRSQSETVFSTSVLGGTDKLSVTRIDEVRGFGDILLMGSLRLPFEYKWFDLAVRGGYFLPTSEYQPAEPTHRLTSVSTTDSYSYQVDYHFNNRNGFGVPVYVLSAAGKLTLSKFSLEATFSLREPVKEGKSIRWEQAAIDKEFSYYSKPYTYMLDRTIEVDASLHYQATGWFDINFNCNYHHTAEGWTEYWGNKYRNPEETLITLEPGLEIQITPMIRIHETAGFPVSGKNTYAPFYLFTTFSFNFFPF